MVWDATPQAARAILAATNDHEFADVPLGALVLACLRLHCQDKKLAAKTAQIDAADGRSLSLAALLREAVRSAAGWRALGVRPGQRLGFYSWNRLELFPAILGAFFEGITVVLLVPFATQDELRHYLKIAPPVAILSERGLLGLALAEAAPGVQHVVVGDQPEGGSEAAGVITLEEVLRRGDALGVDAEAYQAVPVAADHTVCITYSSGTSGRPKGVMLPNRALLGTSIDTRAVWRGPAGGRVLIAHPMSWVTGLLAGLAVAIRAETSVLHNYVDEKRLLHVLELHEVSTLLCAPPRLGLLAQHVQDLKAQGRPLRLGALRFVRSAGSVLPPSIQREAESALGVPVLQLYGTTEAGIIAGYPSLDGTLLQPGRPVKPGCTGYLLPGIELRLVDVDSGCEVVKRGRLGEVRVKTPFLMSGYVAGEQGFDELGYYCTGDVGFLDEDGGLHLVDRIKELLTFDEFDVAPAEIEAVLASHSAVREACVVGRKHPRLDDLPTAFVVLKPGASATEQELKDLVAGTLADHKRLRGGVVFVPEIPKSSYGKVLRRELRDRLNELPPVRDEDLL